MLSGLLNPTVSGPLASAYMWTSKHAVCLTGSSCFSVALQWKGDLAITASKVRQEPAILSSWENLKPKRKFQGCGLRLHPLDPGGVGSAKR